MDVSFLRSKDAALTCDYCNYPRRGLPEGSLCPECGNPPPEVAESDAGKSGFTRNQQTQFRLACVGLIILMIASYYALRVCIVMDGEAISAINVPSPKVSGVVLVQREIGGRPGEWGVLGWMSSLWTIIGVWLITARRTLHQEAHIWASCRQTARWACIILTGGLMGYLLSDLNDYIPLNGRYTDGLMLVALISVEIPANFFLFRYLKQLAIQVRQPRLGQWLGTLAWIGALARLIQLLTLLPGDQMWSHIPYWRMITGVVESMIAIPIGVISWGAILVLTGALMKIGFSSSAQRGVLLLRDHPGVIHKLFAIGEKHVYRILIACGLAGWMLLAISRQSENLLAYQMSFDLRSNSPSITFAGPQISAMIHWYVTRYERGPFVSQSLLTEMFVIMLLTTAIPGQNGGESKLRFTLRWVVVIVICMTTQVMSQISFTRVHPGVSNTLITFFIDAFSTCAMYYYLSLVAKRINAHDTSTWLRRLALILPLLIMAPKLFLILRSTIEKSSFLSSLLTAILCAINLVAFLICLQVLSRFAYAILKPLWQPQPEPVAIEK